MQLTDLLKRARKAKGLNQSQVAELMKTDQSSYSKLERGLLDMTHTRILKFCNAIEITIQDFYADFIPDNLDQKTAKEYIIEIENLKIQDQKLIYKALEPKFSK